MELGYYQQHEPQVIDRERDRVCISAAGQVRIKGMLALSLALLMCSLFLILINCRTLAFKTSRVEIDVDMKMFRNQSYSVNSLIRNSPTVAEGNAKNFQGYMIYSSSIFTLNLWRLLVDTLSEHDVNYAVERIRKNKLHNQELEVQILCRLHFIITLKKHFAKFPA